MTTSTRILVLAVTLTMVAAPVYAENDEGHGHDDDGHSHDHGDDVVLWEGAGRDDEDCSQLDPGQIRWELDPGTDHDVTSVELHIDEPEASVTPTDGPPFEWVTPFYDLGLIEADADGFVGTPGADAELRIVAYCPGELASTGAPMAPIVLTGMLAIAALSGGARLARRRPSR